MNPTTTPAATTQPTTRLAQLAEQWCGERITADGTKPANAQKQAKRLRTFFRQHEFENLEHLTRAALVRAFGQQGGTPKTRMTLMSLVASFCTWCVRAGHMQVNPMSTLGRPVTRASRGPTARRGLRPLSNQEVAAIVRAAIADEQAAAPRIKAFRSLRIMFAWLTGGRHEQINSLRWRDLDLDSAAPAVVYDADAAKNGSGWKIPMPAALAQAARAWRQRCEVAEPDDLVFPEFPRYRLREFVKDMTRAKVSRVKNGRKAGFHSLRKTFARNLVFGGVPVNVAQQLMQHKTLEMTLSVYAECQQEDKIAAADAANQHVEKEIAGAIYQPGRPENRPSGPTDGPPNAEDDLTRVGGTAESITSETMVAFPRQLDPAPRAELPAAFLATGLATCLPAAGGSAVGAVGSLIDVVAGENRQAGHAGNSSTIGLGGFEPPTVGEGGRNEVGGALGGGLIYVTATERALIAALRREESLRLRVRALTGSGVLAVEPVGGEA